MNTRITKKLLIGILLALVAFGSDARLAAQTMSQYTAYPPFISQWAPPIVTLIMSRDHRLFYRAYTDVSDLDEDGVVDNGYKDTIDYYGYFGANTCYTYSTTNNRFEPSVAATGTNKHYCTSKWSGNFLNWATMARMDIVRKVLYGGYRKVDTTTTTVLSRTLMPRDAHAWAKVYRGSDITSLIPYAWTSVTLCNLNTDASETSSRVFVKNGFYPYTASTEGQQCVDQEPGGSSLSPDYQLTTDVLVCSSSLLESNCREYNDGTAHYKPVGVMQRMGTNTQGTSGAGDDAIQVKFALITGTYKANFSGGVLRSPTVDINAEIDKNTGVVLAGSKIINTINKFKVVQYNYSTGWYDIPGPTYDPISDAYDCSLKEPLNILDGLCMSWGNPIGEMYYEALRFVMGKTSATSQFKPSDQDASANNGVSGLSTASMTDPYASCPACSKLFALVLSDPYPSFDSDQLPGSYWPKSISTSDTPSVQTLLSNAGIDTLEGIGRILIGESAGTYDSRCTAKDATAFGKVRGLCVEEPTKEGAYYLAGLANYAKTTDLRSSLSGIQNLTTYAVITGSPVPTMAFTVNGRKAQIVPTMHDGCPDFSGTYKDCSDPTKRNGDNSKGQIVDFQICQNDDDWTGTNGEKTKWGFTDCFDIMYDDAEYGWDHEMDARYRVYVKTDASTNAITIKTKGLFAAAGHTQFMGYIVTGVNAPGEYFDLRCGGKAGNDKCDISYNGNNNPTYERTFTVTGSTSEVLKDPLWYAAKYGGFEDKDGSKTPNLAEEWDKDGNGMPDTYFNGSNPLQLETRMTEAFLSIIDRASSGTAASVLASSATGEGSLYQSFFFTRRTEGTREVRWIGFTQGLFVDTFGNLREDTNGDGKLTYKDDRILVMRFDTNSNETLVDRFADTTPADGTADSSTPVDTVELKDLKGIWEAGKQLALKDPATRKILTWVDPDADGKVDTGEQIAFSTANAAALTPYLRAGASPYTATNLINYIRGTQVTGLRDRQLTVNGSLKVWKLGDPIYATPTIVGAPKERFDLLYGDASYMAYYQKYRTRRQVAYVGANDGMLHAFNGGFYHRGDDTSTTTIEEHGWFTKNPTDNTSGPVLGDELWGFIPKELLPQLRWLADPQYSHVYYVDLKPKVTDVRIFTPDTDHPNGWGTILIGGFRMGGSCKNCASTAPGMTVTADFNGDGDTTDPDDTRVFYSAYFVLDITNPETDPKLLWSFSDPELGLTTSYPTVVRVSPLADAPTDNTNAKWIIMTASGPTGYDAASVQEGRMYALEMPKPYAAGSALTVTSFLSGASNGFVGDLASVDVNLDYRADVVYAGGVIKTGSTPAWAGKMFRLTMGTAGPFGGETTPANWGYGTQPTVLLASFPPSGTTYSVGPVATAPAVTRDDSHKLWVFFGTGRYYTSSDVTNTDQQWFFGVKDQVPFDGCTQTSALSCQENDLVNVSGATLCIVCTGGTTQVTGVTGATDLNTLQGLVASKDGWYTTLPTSKERVVVAPTLLGGIVFFPSFTPSTDVCVAAGDSSLYALFYLTGSAYKESVIGTYTSGGNTNITRSTSLGTGMMSQMAVHVHDQVGDNSANVCAQSSTGQSICTGVKPALAFYSHYLSWIHQYE